MKKINSILMILAAVAGFTNCTKAELVDNKEAGNGGTVVYATTDAATKTALADDYNVLWSAGDQIKFVKDGATSTTYTFTLSEGAGTTNGTFTCASTPADGTYDVYYPATYDDTNWPAQTYVSATDISGAPMKATATVSGGEVSNISFKNEGGILRYTVKGTKTIKSINVKSASPALDVTLDCGTSGVALTTEGTVFNIAVPAGTYSNATLTFTATDNTAATKAAGTFKVAKNVVSLATFEASALSFDLITFKAVYYTNANTLTFYYDAVDHSGTGITVYESSNLFDDLKSGIQKWGYYSNLTYIKSVVIDESVKDYKDLTSTTYMFCNMQNATSISGAEYLDVSDVTDMSYMFMNFGVNTTDLNTIPDVSKWNTGNVTNMSYMFQKYGNKSTSLAAVPDVSGWETVNVKNMKSMFVSYGNASTVLDEVPDVSGWKTDNVTDMSYMFQSYGYSSTVLDEVPDVSGWKTFNVTNMSYMFQRYGYSSTVLDKVPDVSGWNTEKVTDWGEIFHSYGSSSTALTTVPDVSGWKTDSVTDIANMFYGYGSSNIIDCVLDLSGWNLAKIEEGECIFDFYPKSFKVTIPVKTGDEVNKADCWYYGEASEEIKPALKPGSTTERYSFTLLPAGALKGVFSVSTNKKVHFSQGNLYFDGSAFKFETNQYDYPTTWSASHVGHLHWSKNASVAYAVSYSESGTSTSDVLFTNATAETAKSDFTVNGVTGKYRALSMDEWTYLFNNHVKKWITVCGIQGYALAPDGVSADAISNPYSDDAAWKTAQDAGIVFLPFAGFREGSSFGDTGGYGYYWSSSASSSSTDNAYRLCFNSLGGAGKIYDGRKYGESVRLVTDCE